LRLFGIAVAGVGIEADHFAAPRAFDAGTGPKLVSRIEARSRRVHLRQDDDSHGQSRRFEERDNYPPDVAAEYEAAVDENFELEKAGKVMANGEFSQRELRVRPATISSNWRNAPLSRRRPPMFENLSRRSIIRPGFDYYLDTDRAHHD
jgi:hypothetical protein